MVRTVRPAGPVAGLAIYLLLMVSGCQKDQAATATAEIEPQADTKTGAPPQVSTATEETPQATSPEKSVELGERPVPEPEPEAVELALKLPAGQAMTYRVTTETQRSVEWMGPALTRPAAFKDSRTGNHIEMTFEQRVREVRDDGGALVEVTIEALEYAGEVQNNVVLDFDSAKNEDPNHPLAKLIGKSYRLEISPRGQVLTLVDVEPVRRAVPGGSPASGTTLKLLSDEEIRDRHEIPPLFALQENPVRPGRNWSDLKTFSFGMMGAKSYERVYTLKEVRQEEGRSAVVEMKAIPSSALAEEVHKQQTASPLSSLFDNIESYDGRLVLDLGNGQVREYVEQMRTEWVIADPAGAQDGSRPAALKMTARRLHRLERVQ